MKNISKTRINTENWLAYSPMLIANGAGLIILSFFFQPMMGQSSIFMTASGVCSVLLGIGAAIGAIAAKRV